MTSIAYLLAAFAALAAQDDSDAVGGYFTGTELYEMCTARPSDRDYQQKQSGCIAYVAGVSDSMRAIQSVQGPQLLCTPGNVRLSQLKDHVVRYFTDRPDMRQYQAASSVIVVLMERYPCR